MCSRIYPTLPLGNRTGAVGEVEIGNLRNSVPEEGPTRYPPPKRVTVRTVGDLDFMSCAASDAPQTQREPNVNYPIREKDWRFEGEVDLKAQEFAQRAVLHKDYSPEALEDLMKRGDELVIRFGDVRDAVRQIQEYRLRSGEDLLSNIKEVTHLSPVLGGGKCKKYAD